MLEILILIKGSQKLLSMGKDRGIAGWPFVIPFIFLWFGGEIGGAIAGFIILGVEGDGFNFGVYLCAVAGAAIADHVRDHRAIDEDDDLTARSAQRDQQDSTTRGSATAE